MAATKKRAYSVYGVFATKYRTIPTEGKWLEAIGKPELGGSWMIYGAPKNGKTSLAMQVARYLSERYRVAYNSVEEGISLSFKKAMIREDMLDVKHNFVVYDKYSVQELTERLARRCSPEVVVIDSVQFMGITWSEYKSLKEKYPHKLFVYVSHIEGAKPEGQAAQRIWRDCNVYFRVEGFRAFPTGRYGGGMPFDIEPVRANEYWGMK